MNKEKAQKIAIELNKLGLTVEFEAVEFCESQYLSCEGCNPDDCWIVKVVE